jgi:hypothetical protein
VSATGENWIWPTFRDGYVWILNLVAVDCALSLCQILLLTPEGRGFTTRAEAIYALALTVAIVHLEARCRCSLYGR